MASYGSGPRDGSTTGATGPFERSDRLLDSRDYRHVLRRGRRRTSPELVIITAKSALKSNKSSNLPDKLPDRARLGITVSRKVGNAVVRNRFKRRTREWFRSQRSLLNPELDLVVIARRPGGRLSFSELDARLSGLLDIPPLIGPRVDSSTMDVSTN